MGWLEVAFGRALALERGDNYRGRSVHGAGARGLFVLRARTRKDKLGPGEYLVGAGILQSVPESRKRIQGINISAELTIRKYMSERYNR